MLETIDSQGGHYTKDMFITVKKIMKTHLHYCNYKKPICLEQILLCKIQCLKPCSVLNL